MSDNNINTHRAGGTGEVFSTFLRLGLTSFGGPVAHLGYFRKALVEKRNWVSEEQYAQLLAVCQFLPGPASSQLGFVLGMHRAGWTGALAAFTAFTLPSVILLLLFASLLPMLPGEFADGLIHALKIVACAVVADAVLGMSKKLCPDAIRGGIAVVTAAAILATGTAWGQLLLVLAGAIAGIMFCPVNTLSTGQTISVPYGKHTAAWIFGLFILLFIALSLFAGEGMLFGIADAFYRPGAMVFGGGHVVLPLLEESVVSTGWVSQSDFLAGYGAAQAIPGPMFAFSAWLGAAIPSDYPLLITALLALIFMFLPGFLIVAAALPAWQAVVNKPNAAKAIAGVNAAVVGLLAAALYDPIFTTSIETSLDAAIAIVGFGILAIWKRSPLYVVGWCVAASLVVQVVS